MQLIPEANIVLFTRTAPGELNRICGNDMEEKVLYVNPSFNKRGLLDAIRFYAFNHNLILLLMGHGTSMIAHGSWKRTRIRMQRRSCRNRCVPLSVDLPQYCNSAGVMLCRA